jgi:hypothetical protein
MNVDCCCGSASVNTEAFQVELLKLVLSLIMLEEVIQVKRFCLYIIREGAWMRGAGLWVGGQKSGGEGGT